MVTELRTAADAVAIEERFNGFHDGFVASIELRSRDRFVEEAGSVGHELSGRFDLRLEIAHYNYGGGLQPLSRRVVVIAEDVRDFALDLNGVTPESWPLVAVEFVPVGTAEQPRFAVEVLRSHLEGPPGEQRWVTARERWCTIAGASFKEVDRL